ncbi:hypothetical protein, partial [Micromonospora tarensis]|uniref:hypothetical protein n=1 Tax=Micromonospora tarensis TaxID=2806100 RepID=UPI0028168306
MAGHQATQSTSSAGHHAGRTGLDHHRLGGVRGRRAAQGRHRPLGAVPTDLGEKVVGPFRDRRAGDGGGVVGVGDVHHGQRHVRRGQPQRPAQRAERGGAGVRAAA